MQLKTNSLLLALLSAVSSSVRHGSAADCHASSADVPHSGYFPGAPSLVHMQLTVSSVLPLLIYLLPSLDFVL